MAIGDLPANAKIRFEKDYARVKTSYALGVPVGSPALDGTNKSDQRLHSIRYGVLAVRHWQVVPPGTFRLSMTAIPGALLEPTRNH